MDLHDILETFGSKTEPLYSNLEIIERIDGLLEIMFNEKQFRLMSGEDTSIEYQPFAIKIILFEIFQNANMRHREKVNNLKN